MKLSARVRGIMERGFGVEDFVNAIYRCVLAADAAMAMAVLAGGNARFASPTYQPLLDLAGGRSWVWGVAIGVAAILMAVHSQLLNMIGLGLSFLWNNLFAVMFVTAIVRYPDAGSTAPIPYATLSLVHVALMTLKVVEYRERRRR